MRQHFLFRRQSRSRQVRCFCRHQNPEGLRRLTVPQRQQFPHPGHASLLPDLVRRLITSVKLTSMLWQSLWKNAFFRHVAYLYSTISLPPVILPSCVSDYKWLNNTCRESFSATVSTTDPTIIFSRCPVLGATAAIAPAWLRH